MKAVIVELNKERAAVLSEDGCVISVKNNHYELGQVIQLSSKKKSLAKKLSILAASAAAFIVLWTGTWAYASPYTYVSVDVNPSIEFTLNRFDRVIKVKAVNDDGEEILKEISLDDLKNETIENALQSTVEQISEAGYFDGNIEGGIVIATSSEDTEKADELALQLQETAQQEAASNGDTVAVEAFSVTQERVQEAKELGVTPGKLNLVEKLQEAAGDSANVNIDEWLDKPVKEIMKATKEYKEVSKAAEKGNAKETSDDPSEVGVTATEDQNQNNQNQGNQSSNKDEKQAQKEEDKSVKEAEKEADKTQKETAKEESKAEKEADKDAKRNQKNSLSSGKDKKSEEPAVTPSGVTPDSSNDIKDNNGKSDNSSKNKDKSSGNNGKKNGENDANPDESTDNELLDSNSEITQEDTQDNDEISPTGEASQETIGQDDKGNKGKADQDNQASEDNSNNINQGSDNSSPGSDISDNSEHGSNNNSDTGSQSSADKDNNGQGSESYNGKGSESNKGQGSDSNTGKDSQNGNGKN